MSLPAVTLELSGERLVATYEVSGDEPTARSVLAHLCVEQTIEFPADLVADDDIKAHLIARVEDLREVGGAEPDGAAAGQRWAADVSFAVEVAGAQLPQLLNMLFGNISLLPGVRLVAVDWPPAMLAPFAGPRFGSRGLRELLGADERPLLATALKPMGLPLTELAAIAGDVAANGMDLIKDDHGLASQPYANFHQRVELCAAAVAEANERAGTGARYLPSLNVPADQLAEAARFAADAGAGGVMVLPGLHGYDAVRVLAEDDTLGLPVMGHPSLLGSFVTSPTSGIDHGLVFGTFMRLAGVDVSVFPTFGGRFAFSRDECRRIVEASREELGDLRPTIPAPAGGMTLERIPEMVEFYGRDVALLIGGELHRGDRRERTRAMYAAALGAA